MSSRFTTFIFEFLISEKVSSRLNEKPELYDRVYLSAVDPYFGCTDLLRTARQCHNVGRGGLLDYVSRHFYWRYTHLYQVSLDAHHKCIMRIFINVMKVVI